MSTAEAISEIKGLDVSDRLKALNEIWDSILGEEQQLEAPSWQKTILSDRLSNLKESPNQGDTWQKVKKRIRGNT